jgi:hypothetical protein
MCQHLLTLISLMGVFLMRVSVKLSQNEYVLSGDKTDQSR